MLDTTRTGFRAFLRNALATDHDRVDRLYSCADLTNAGGLSAFFTAQFAALAGLVPVASPGGRTGRPMLARMVAALEHDLGVLGKRAPTALAFGRVPDPVALDHILLGSRLGTEVLKRRWVGSTDRACRTAAGYLSLEADPGAWRAHCTALDTIDYPSCVADRVIDDARALFRHFEQAARVHL